jgi:hypothetical protein
VAAVTWEADIPSSKSGALRYARCDVAVMWAAVISSDGKCVRFSYPLGIMWLVNVGPAGRGTDDEGEVMRRSFDGCGGWSLKPDMSMISCRDVFVKTHVPFLRYSRCLKCTSMIL